MSKVLSPAAREFELGLKADQEAGALVAKAVGRLIVAGRHYRTAQRIAQHGEFGALIEAAQVSRTQVYRAIEFVQGLEDWLKEKHPSLHGAKLDKAVEDAVLHSPKGITAWMRAIGLIKEVGAYDADAYERKKLAGEPQLSFAFEYCHTQLRALVQTKQVFELSRSSLLKLKTELEEARAKVEEALAGKTKEEPAHAI